MKRALRQMGDPPETVPARARRLALIATASFPPGKRRIAIDAFVCGYLAAEQDMCDVPTKDTP